MTGQARAFFLEAVKNKALKAALDAIDTSDEASAVRNVVLIAKEYGFEIAPEDVTVKAGSKQGLLEDDGLDSVAGGLSALSGCVYGNDVIEEQNQNDSFQCPISCSCDDPSRCNLRKHDSNPQAGIRVSSEMDVW